MHNECAATYQIDGKSPERKATALAFFPAVGALRISENHRRWKICGVQLFRCRYNAAG